MISIIVSIYKNEKNIIPFIKDFNENIRPNIDDYEIIFVDDASPDDSWNILCKLAESDDHIKLIRHSRNFGAVAASYTGLKHASGDCATVRACDLQEPASVLLDMFSEWKQGHKSVIAVREKRNDSHISSFFSNVYYRLVQKLVDEKMPTGGFDTYLIDRVIINKIIELDEKNAPITLQILWLGFNPRAIYYERMKRDIGKSSWTLSKKTKLFVDTVVCFSYIPIRLMTLIGLFFSMSSFIWAIYLVIMKILNRVDMKGYTSIIVLVMFSAGLIMFTLGILGEYLWRILDSSRGRPISVVQDKINFNKEHEQHPTTDKQYEGI